MQATEQQIHQFYERRGCEVKIDHEGHVTYRFDGWDDWLEGRWVEEYHFEDGVIVIK